MFKIVLLIFVASIAMSNGIRPTNYDISRNQLGGFGIRDVLDYLLGGNYGNYYPGNYYPDGGYYPGQGPPGPPGAHPGCPLCDSSVYSYCSHKQAHDSCCCGSLFNPYCRRVDCKSLYSNSCEEHQLITRCCCVDLYKNAVQDAPVVV